MAIDIFNGTVCYDRELCRRELNVVNVIVDDTIKPGKPCLFYQTFDNELWENLGCPGQQFYIITVKPVYQLNFVPPAHAPMDLKHCMAKAQLYRKAIEHMKSVSRFMHRAQFFDRKSAHVMANWWSRKLSCLYGITDQYVQAWRNYDIQTRDYTQAELDKLANTYERLHDYAEAVARINSEDEDCNPVRERVVASPMQQMSDAIDDLMGTMDW